MVHVSVMSNNPGEILEASFIEGSRGKLFCIRALPQPEIARGHSVLMVPPFAEEMNSSRRFFALMRQELCKNGYGIIQPDLHGTGDSEGLFSEASWENWLSDLLHLIKHFCGGNGEYLSVLALRCGCLLTQDLLTDMTSTDKDFMLKYLLYVQPEQSGFDVLNTQFRMRVASNRLSGNASESTESIWQKLESEGNVRVAGYDVGYELAAQMRNSRFFADTPLPAEHLKWIELGTHSDIAPVGGKWKECGILSKPFWQSHDVEPEQYTIEAIAALIND